MLSHAGVDFDVEVSNVDEERIKSRAGDKPVEEIAAAPLGGLDDVWRIDREARRIATSMFNRTL